MFERPMGRLYIILSLAIPLQGWSFQFQSDAPADSHPRRAAAVARVADYSQHAWSFLHSRPCDRERASHANTPLPFVCVSCKAAAALNSSWAWASIPRCGMNGLCISAICCCFLARELGRRERVTIGSCISSCAQYKSSGGHGRLMGTALYHSL